MLNLNRGFLPAEDPLLHLPAPFAPWEQLGQLLPKLLVSYQLRSAIEDAPHFPIEHLRGMQEYERAMVLLSFLGHAYVWGYEEPAPAIPAVLAIPWHYVATELGRPPVMSYDSYALQNWRRINPSGPISLGNIALIQNFLAGIDEEWFVLIHVEIEAKAAPALKAIIKSQAAVVEGNIYSVVKYLDTMADSLKDMCDVLDRMPENCDPYIYYNRVRPYIHGWKDHPALPDGVYYRGVEAYEDKPQKFRGETGAQSGIVPTIDAALGIVHAEGPLQIYLLEMRDYMPPEHSKFIETIESGPSIREFVLAHKENEPALAEAYNKCIKLVHRFRETHIGYAAQYIQKQSQQSLSNPTETGTGGTPFMEYLRKHLDEVQDALIQ